MSNRSIGKEVMYESRNLKGYMRVHIVSPILIGTDSSALITITEFWPLINHENIIIKFSTVSSV